MSIPPSSRDGGVLEKSSPETKHAHKSVDRSEISRNAIILPPLGSASSPTAAVRGEAGRDQRCGSKSKRHGSSSSAASTRLHDYNIPREGTGGCCTPAGKGSDKQEEYSASSRDEDRREAAAGSSAAAGAQDDANEGMDDKEKQEEKGSKTDEAPDGKILGPHVSGGVETLSVGEEEGWRNPVSPVAAVRARLGGGLRNLLTLGSEAQVSPGSGSPTCTMANKSRAPDESDRPLGSPQRDHKPAAEGESSGAEQPVNGDLRGRAGAREESVSQAAAAAAPALAPENLRRILARDNTLTPFDEWPELLDDEADPSDWALGNGEGEVLAAARRMGSVLVRVVTWNLHAKPPPAAETLREHLLHPGKASRFAHLCCYFFRRGWTKLL